MNKLVLLLIGCFCLLMAHQPIAQRVYANQSVLATGNWYKMAVKQEGIYKIDLAFLNGLGINTANLSAASIRVFGNGGGMVPENNALPRIDDLAEISLDMNDGGDGIFNGSDYCLFYAPGPNQWSKDSLNSRFKHTRNRYTDTAFYFLTIGGIGARILTQTTGGAAGITVSSYDERYYYENNLVNLLNSGREWYGEEFNNNPGGNSSRNFSVDWTGLQLNQPVTLIADMAAASVGGDADITITANGKPVQGLHFLAVSGNFLDPFATSVNQANLFTPSQSTITLNFSFSSKIQGARAWLNWFELFGRKSLSMNGNNPLFFRDWQSVNQSAIASFQITNVAATTNVWEITDAQKPIKMAIANTGNQTSFSNDVSRLREYVAFANTGLSAPIPMGKLANQNLHQSTNTQMLVITHPLLLKQANRLAAYHLQHDNLSSVVVTIDQVYNEFSGGVPDPAGIRDFVKMYYDKAGSDTAKRPCYLLLFGAGSYDYQNRIPGNSNLVPVFESANSLDPLLTYTSDDFFGLLDNTDDINQSNPNSLLDIGIGRIPAGNEAEAAIMVDKILRYQSAKSQGAWRNQSVYIADDQDDNLHVNDAEFIAADAASANTQLNQYKVYLDAYPLVSGSGGARYPAANEAIVNQVNNGTLLVNYTGHGSYLRLAEEAVLTQTELSRFRNPDKLPLFITASCDFAPHDDPQKKSLGAALLTADSTGAIALLTTTRLVFAYTNRQINDSYLKIALKPAANGDFLSLGESVKLAKNYTALLSGDFLNNRKFTLLGDPALQLAFPKLNLQLTTLNNQPINAADTLRALEKYTFTGIVTDAAGKQVTDFSGLLQVRFFDKAQTVKTLGNTTASPPLSFTQQAGILYQGNATVQNGQFSFSFIVPQDISYQPGKSRISLYAGDGIRDAGGINTKFYVGGQGAVRNKDIMGPVIKPYINDEQFLNGGITNEFPLLLLNLFDSSGINTIGNGIGHDITVSIDGDDKNSQVLNNFYTATNDSYQSGQVLFQLPEQTEGKHTLTIKAWDVANNSSTESLDYVVKKQAQLLVTKLRNFPNPFVGTTRFSFEHNQPGKDLQVTINIFDAEGKRVKQIKQQVNTAGTRNCEIIWRGDTDLGAKLTKGHYIYQVIVVAGNEMVKNTQQLILF
jgi:hypothetical protein